MRVRNVTTVLGIGAFVFLCLTPELAQAQLRMGYSGPGNYQAGPAVYGQSLQPGYYGSPSYWPGTAYGPGVSYGPGTSYAPGVSYGAPMYQPQPYAYQPAAPGGCPPAQPISPSALTSAPPQAMPSPATGSATTPSAATHAVAANDDTFEPKTLTIQPGATVTWTNRGQHAHTVTFEGVGVDSADIQPGGSFSATFPHAGTYNYYCRHHKDMRATIVVSQDGGTGGTGGTGAKY